MHKFSEIIYKRPDIKSVKKQFMLQVKKLKNAADYKSARDAFIAAHDIIDEAETSYSIASVRNTMDMTDKFYENEIKYLDGAFAMLTGPLRECMKALLASRFREGFEKEFGPQLLRLTESDYRTRNTKNVFLMIAEDRLTCAYSKTAAVSAIDFQGKKCNFYRLLKYMQSRSRTERRAAFEAWAKLYESISGKLDNYYDKLIRIRKKMARRAGFESYIDFVYLARSRFDWTAQDAALFRAQIHSVITPLCDRLFHAQAERIGADKLRYYDETLIFPDGNAAPRGTADDILKAAAVMYRELSPETGDFFDFMTVYELFDLESRPNKHLGGYCTGFVKYRAPFIFSNFNSTAADIDVLTHEAGHAFQLYTASSAQTITGYISSTAEINEIHSMAMEYFTYPWMELFFGESSKEEDGVLTGADKYRVSHLWTALSSIPYLAAVDEYQHMVFSGPAPDAADRRRIWRKTEQKYMPWRDYDGNAFLEAGGFWMQKQHIFLYPFYYIEYAIAQICVFELYGRMKTDRAGAWNDYCRLCAAGGSLGYGELLNIASLRDPMSPGAVATAVGPVAEEIQSILT
ncbi:MAG: M3 family oligoendopeptidase [Eubacteriales bacterium]|nr:M3 family oligoendopeptidase [Eubacteriales bacterium]